MFQNDTSAATRGFSARQTQIFVDGAWREPHSSARIDIIDPSTEAKIGEIADCDARDVDDAVGAARRAFDDGRWSGLSGAVRADAMMRLAGLIEQHAGELAELESVDNGKTRTMAAMIDLPATITTLKQTAGWASRLNGETLEPLVSSAPARASTPTRGASRSACAG